MLPYFRKPHSPDPGPGPPLALLLGSCRCQGALAPPRGQRAALMRTATFRGLRCNRAGLGRRRLDQKTCPSGRLSSGQPGRPPCIHGLGQAGGAHGDWVLSHPGAGATGRGGERTAYPGLLAEHKAGERSQGLLDRAHGSLEKTPRAKTQLNFGSKESKETGL